MIARSELRRRRGSLTLLAILVAVSSAVTLAGFAGARWTDSVLDRFLAGPNARDVGAVIQSAHLIQNPDRGITLRDRIAEIDGRARRCDGARLSDERGDEVRLLRGVQP